MLPIPGTLPPPPGTTPRAELPFPTEPPVPLFMSSETPEGAERGAPRLDDDSLDVLGPEEDDPPWLVPDARKIWFLGGLPARMNR